LPEQYGAIQTGVTKPALRWFADAS
jgi:hypothetical protein